MTVGFQAYPNKSHESTIYTENALLMTSLDTRSQPLIGLAEDRHGHRAPQHEEHAPRWYLKVSDPDLRARQILPITYIMSS